MAPPPPDRAAEQLAPASALADRGPLAPPVSHDRFPLFDSLRGFAAIAILFVHVAIFTGATNAQIYGRFVSHLDIGVPFFFLLSAFLLYRPYLAARVRGTPRTPFASYAKRRLVRIAPAYWAALTVAALVPGFAGALSGNWWVYYGLLQNYPIYTAQGTCTTDPYRCGMPVAWSLSIEVVFYLVLPLFVLAMGWLGRRRKRGGWLPLELAAVAVISVVSIVIQSFGPSSDLQFFAFFSPLGRGWWFGLGLMLAALSVWAAEREREPRFVGWIRRSPAPPLLAAGALYVVACVFLLQPTPSLAFPIVARLEYVAEYLLFGLIAALILLPAAFGADGPGHFRRLLRHPLPTWLGLISYGIFLWQFPVLVFLLDAGVLDLWPSMAFPLLLVSTLAGTIICAAISYYALERPLIRRARSRPPDPELGGGELPGPRGARALPH